MTFRPSTSSETAARFHISYVRRIERQLSDRPWGGLRWTAESVNCLREILVEQVGYFPRTRSAIFEAVRGEYGSCDSRRLERALKWALDSGLIERVDDGYRHVRVRRSA